MTISTTASRISHNGNGATVEFSFPYRFLVNSDLVVVQVATDGTEDVLTLNTDYTVAGADQDSGGTVTLNTAPLSGERVVIYRSMSLTQEVDYATGDSFPAETHERALDRLTMLVQQQQDAIDRSAKLPETSTADAESLVADLIRLADSADNIDTVAGIESDVSDVAAIDSNITTVAGIAANVTTVAGIASNVTTVAGIDSDVTTVAGISTDVQVVADISVSVEKLATQPLTADIGFVAAIDEDVSTVAGIASDVTAVAAVASDVSAIAAIDANVTGVANIAADVTTVAGIESDVSAVAAIEADVSTVAAIEADVSTCADNIAAILDAPAQASAAAASAAAAALTYDSFDDRYLGAKNSAPSVDNDGNALVAGAMYFNTGISVADDKGMWIYDGGTWIQASAASQAILVKYKYTATAGQTTFTGDDDNALTLSYTAGSIIVTLNGVVMDAADYTATNGNSVVLASAAALNDEIGVFAFSTFDIANAVAKSGDTMTGSLNFSGNGLRITGDFSNATVANRVLFQTSTTNGLTLIRAIPNGTATQSNIAVTNSSDPANCSLMQIVATAGDTQLSSGINGTGTYLPMTFYTGGSERMRIDSSGNLLVNTTSPIGSGPTVVFKGPATAGQQALTLHNPATSGTRFFQTFGTEATYTERGYITWNGSTMALSNASDVRLKENIVDAPSALPKIAALQIRSFDFKEDGRHVDYGFIAQELDDVIPSAVFKGSETENGEMDKPWSVGLEPIIPVLVKAIQEQQAIITQLQADVAALKGNANV